MEEFLDIENILRETPIETKLRMLSGDGMWHTFSASPDVPRVRMSDGPNGLRTVNGVHADAEPATCFPTASVLADSWDVDLVREVGAAMGREAIFAGVDLLLAPGLNIKRNPLCGRNFEYFSEDPYLAGTLGKALVAGVQSTGVGACVKHFAANNQESYRMYTDSIVDMRALRELYLKPFEIALGANPAAVMCAYNKLNGEYCSQDRHLLKDILRDDWGYAGLTVSDWGAVHDRAAALAAGLDLEMPDSLGIFYSELERAYRDGEITERDVDDSLRRILSLAQAHAKLPHSAFSPDKHDEIAYRAAAQSVVLLKNEGLLPFTKDKHVAVVGELAEDCPIQGGGSSHVNAIKKLSPLQAFELRGIDVKYFRGYSADAKDNAALAAQAVEGAADAHAVIVYVGAPAPYEGADRTDMALPSEQDAVITALADAGYKVAVVIVGQGPYCMPWLGKVSAVVYAGLGGQAGALAVADVLYGRVNPRGRLAETFPFNEGELGDDFGKRQTLYRESLFVGYKYYDALERRVLFPFGHGLSYSDIVYDKVTVRRKSGNAFEVSVTLTNRSARDGYETVQVYVADNTGRVMTPPKQLAAFAKVFVEGQTTVTRDIELSETAFRFFDPTEMKNRTCDGEFKIIVAASATDIKHKVSVHISGDFVGKLDYPKVYDLPIRDKITDEDFLAVYGAPFPSEPPMPVKGTFGFDSCIDDMKKTFIGKILLSVVKHRAAKTAKAGTPERAAAEQSMLYTPLSAVVSMSDGAMTVDIARGIIDMANGKFFKGVRNMLKRKSGEK